MGQTLSLLILSFGLWWALPVITALQNAIKNPGAGTSIGRELIIMPFLTFGVGLIFNYFYAYSGNWLVAIAVGGYVCWALFRLVFDRSSRTNSTGPGRNKVVTDAAGKSPGDASIDLDFNKDNLVALLIFGSTPRESPYSQQQIVEWCETFWNKYADVDAPEEIEAIMPILADVETQWDLHHANIAVQAVTTLDSSGGSNLPSELFIGWLKALGVHESRTD